MMIECAEFVTHVETYCVIDAIDWSIYVEHRFGFIFLFDISRECFWKVLRQSCAKKIPKCSKEIASDSFACVICRTKRTRAEIYTMPNGYGTVRLSQLLWQPASVLLVVATAESGRRDTQRHMTRTRKCRCIQKRMSFKTDTICHFQMNEAMKVSIIVGGRNMFFGETREEATDSDRSASYQIGLSFVFSF
nr:hypothetical protein [Tanacetum cinerariifolium]